MGRGDCGNRFASSCRNSGLGRKIGLLDHRLALCTGDGGLGVTSDAVLLASAMPVRPGMRILDAGCGVGAIGLCLATRVSGLEVHGLEIDTGLAVLAGRNAASNGIGSCTFHRADLFGSLPPVFEDGFDCVATNPPWQRSDGSTPSPDPRRALARREGGRGRRLGDWMAVCARLVRSRGVLVAVLPMDRIRDAMLCLEEWSVEIQPLQSRAGSVPGRALLRFHRSVAPVYRVHPPFVLHNGREYSRSAERILRDGHAFPWPPRTCATVSDSSIYLRDHDLRDLECESQTE